MHTRGINSVFVLDFAIEVSQVPMFQKQSIGDAFYPKRYSHPRRCVIMAHLLRGYRPSGLVMYFRTLPAPSASAPCISAILTHLRMRVKICILTHPPAALPQYGCPLVLSSTCLAWALGCKNKHFSENKCFYHHNQREKRDVVKKNSRNLKFFLHGSYFWRVGGWKKEMLRKKTHVVRKKTHVVRKIFYVASVFGGAAGRKNRPPWKLSSTAWELSSTAGDFLPTAFP